jgi:hypothetical protein
MSRADASGSHVRNAVCQSGNYLRIWAGSRELNANRRALFANEKREFVVGLNALRKIQSTITSRPGKIVHRVLYGQARRGAGREACPVGHWPDPHVSPLRNHRGFPP